jgi:DEAD/DEAH box helicase domain-containing protein
LIKDFISGLKEKPTYKNQIIFHKIIKPIMPKYGVLNFTLDTRIVQWLSNYKLKLYTHQAEALNLIAEGKHVVITTATASGKTLIFSLEQLRHCFFIQ